MKKDEFEKDIELLKKKAPDIYNDVVEVSSPLHRVYTEFNNINIEFLKEKHNLLMSELDIMSSLFYSGGEAYILSPSQLMQRLLFSSGGMTKALKKLESKNLICRLDNKEDGRSKLVQLTEEGVLTIQKGIKDIFLCESDYFSVLKEHEKKELSRLLLKCLRN